MTAWTLQLCRGWQTIATCSAYRFNGMIRRNTGGDFSIESSPAGIPPTGYTDPDTAELVAFDPRDVDTVRLIVDGIVVFGGYVRGENGGVWLERDALGERWRWTGVDLWGLLEGRLAYPDPATEPAWAVTHDNRTGQASTVLAAYLNANIGPSALTARQVAGFQVADELAGTTLSFSARGQTLASLASRLAKDGGFEVVPTVDTAGVITFRLSSSRDLSAVVVFSDRGDLGESSARFQAVTATYTVTGGDGVGTARVFRTSSTGAAGADRWEQFSDQSGMDNASEVQADADAKTAAASAQHVITTALTDAQATIALRFGLRLGDGLGVIVRGRRYTLPIETVAFEVTPERQVMTPHLGTATVDELTGLKRKVDATAAQFDNNIA